MNSTFSWHARLRLAGLLTVAGLALAGCGGGGGGDDNGGSSGLVSGEAVQPAASQTSGSFMDAVRQVVAIGADETREPLSLQGVNDPPADEASEPVAL